MSISEFIDMILGLTAWSVAINVGTYILLVILTLFVLLLVTILLRMFFKRHLVLNKAHKVLIYLLTMSGVVFLLAAGVIGIFFPLVPGIPLLLMGLLLMRKYHKFVIFERLIAWCHAKIALYKKRHPVKTEAPPPIPDRSGKH